MKKVRQFLAVHVKIVDNDDMLAYTEQDGLIKDEDFKKS